MTAKVLADELWSIALQEYDWKPYAERRMKEYAAQEVNAALERACGNLPSEKYFVYSKHEICERIRAAATPEPPKWCEDIKWDPARNDWVHLTGEVVRDLAQRCDICGAKRPEHK